MLVMLFVTLNVMASLSTEPNIACERCLFLLNHMTPLSSMSKRSFSSIFFFCFGFGSISAFDSAHVNYGV